ncbi:MAG: uL15 family ribosomal protein [Patescibacteria group bacterium]
MILDASKISSGKRVKKNVKRLGRGNGSGKGSYSARGLKGQKARSGGKGGLTKHTLKRQIQQIPKVRGFNSIKNKPEVITLTVLEKNAVDGKEINIFFLKEKGLIKNIKNGVKIVGSGELKKKLIVKNCLATKKAAEAIEKAGGKLVF